MKNILFPLRRLHSLALSMALLLAAKSSVQSQSVWNVNANGNWSAAGSWNAAGVPNGVDAWAQLRFNISANRTVTNDVAGLTLGQLDIGDTTGGSSFTLTGGTIIFDVTTGNAQLNMLNGGGNSTIASALQLEDTLDIVVADTSNNQGLILTGIVSGGSNGSTAMTVNDTSGAGMNWVIFRGVNTYEGQLEIQSGTVRLETTVASVGAVGVGNETVVTPGGSVDLRGFDFNVGGVDATEIFRISGFGNDGNGAGAIRNTSGTATLSHLVLTGDAASGGNNRIDLNNYTDSGAAVVEPIFDMGGFEFSKTGTSDFVLHNATVLNPGVINVREGEFRIENDSGSNVNETLLDGMTVNLFYNKAPLDTTTFVGSDPTQGSRTSDPFNPNTNLLETSGNTVIPGRLEFYRQDGTIHTGAVINVSNGALQRNGPTTAGVSITTTIDATSVINFVGGDPTNNVFQSDGGSNAYNSDTSLYDNPGSLVIQGALDNTGSYNTGTVSGTNAGSGFQIRGSRSVEFQNANTGFDGTVVLHQNTGRYLPFGFNTGTGAAESQHASLILSGANGGLTNASDIIVERYASIMLANDVSESNNDRLGDSSMLDLRNGNLVLEADGVDATENFGNVALNRGASFIFLDSRDAGSGADGSADITLNSVSSTNGGILFLMSPNSGTTFDQNDPAANSGDSRVAVTSLGAGISSVGNAAGTTDRAVVQRILGGVVDAPGTFSVSQRPAWAVENAFAYSTVGAELMTLDGGFLRPLLSSEYDTSAADPAAGNNWRIENRLGNVNARGQVRNVTADVAVNSLTIDHASSTAASDVLFMDPTTTLTINSGIINFTSFAQEDSANMEAAIRGGSLNMNGQVAQIHSNGGWEDLNRNTSNGYQYVTSNNAFIRSSIVNADGLIKTGRSTLYLDTANEFLPGSNAHVTHEASLVVRHSEALRGIDEVVLSGKGNFLLDRGVNITGTNLRLQPQDTHRVALRAETSYHNTFAGDIIIDNADATGSSDFDYPVVTARNNATLTTYGNIYVDPASSAAQTDIDSWNDPFAISTNIAEAGTINFRGQFRDLPGGNLANPTDGNSAITSVSRAGGDSATRLDANHALQFQMTGHDEINANIYQQWDATGRIQARQGYFRVMYDPATAAGSGGFFTDGADALRGTNEYLSRVSLGADGGGNGTYNGHIVLTQPDQVFNSRYIYAYNNNRNGTLTLAGENRTGTVYWGSNDNSTNFSLQFPNQQAERDVRFHQVLGGTMVFNGRLDDENSTAQNFNASSTISGPGTVIFNRNGIGNSDIDRWNFMAGTAIWQAGSMTGNNQFNSANDNTDVGKSTWGGGHLHFQNSGTTARSQELDSDIYVTNGASRITTDSNTTFNLGSAATTFNRHQGSTLELVENGGAINLFSTGLAATDGAFLGAWGVYGDTTGVTDWAARQGTGGGVQAFVGYADDALAAATHTNLTGAPVALVADTNTSTVRFGDAAALDLGGFTLTLDEGGILIPDSNVGSNSIANGSLTSAWTAGDSDLVVHNFGSTSTTTIGAAIVDDGANRVNFVHSGDGRTVLTGANSYSGDTYLNGGIVSISDASQLGTFSDATIVQVQRANIGSNNGASLSGANLEFTTAVAPTGAAATGTYNSNSSQQVTALTLTDGGSGYSTGVHVTTDDNATPGDPSDDGNAGLWAIFDSGNIHFDGGTLNVTESTTLRGERTIWLGGNGGTLDVDPGKVLTVNGYITSEYSHVTTANGFDEANHIGAAYQPASDRNPDIGDLHIAGGGTVEFRYDPDNDGSAEGNMAQTYGGITYIDEGVLRLRGVGSSGPNALGTHRSFLDGTIIGPNGTLNLSYLSSDPTMYEWITMSGYGYQGLGAISQGWSNLNIRLVRLSGQLDIAGDTLFNLRNDQLRLNENGGTLQGTGDIVRKGNNEFYIYGNSPEWTGDLINASGNTRLYGTGKIGGAQNITLQRNTYFGIGNSSTDVNYFNDRIRDDASITGEGWVRLRMESSQYSYNGVEDVGAVTALAGTFGIELDSHVAFSGGALTALENTSAGFRFDSLTRDPGAAFAFRNLDAGIDFADGSFGTTPASAQNKFIVAVDNIALSNPVGGDGTNFNHAILPGFTGANNPGRINVAGDGYLYDSNYNNNRLMIAEAGTYEGTATNFLRPLADNEYLQISNPGTDATNGVDLSALTIGTDQNVALVGLITDQLNTADGTSTDGSYLTARRNSTLFTGGTDITVNSLSFRPESFVAGAGDNRGNTVGLIINGGDTFTVASGVIQSAGFAVIDFNFDRGTRNDNSGWEPDNRTYIRGGGSLDFNGREAIIDVSQISARYNTNNAPENIDMFVANDYDNTQFFVNAPINNTGGNGLTKTGAGALFLQTANNYSGPTNVSFGTLYARNDRALGQSTDVYLSGDATFIVGSGAVIDNVDFHFGLMSRTQRGFHGEQSGRWGGDIILDDIDASGSAGGYVRNFVPRISNNTALFTIAGDVYGGAEVSAVGRYGDGGRVFTTYNSGSGLLNFSGNIRDTQAGAVGALVDDSNQHMTLSMELASSSNEFNVRLGRAWDSGGRIEVKKGTLFFDGAGNFYSDAAAIAQNPDHPSSGFHLGGRSMVENHGQNSGDSLGFFLSNPGNVFNLSSFSVGVDPLDPDNYSGNDNFGRGNKTGDSTIGGINGSGTATFGLGTGSLTFTNDDRNSATYTRDLKLYSRPGGTVALAVNLVDAGAFVDSSITVIGGGEVHLRGSSAGAGSVENVNVGGGLLLFTNYDTNPDNRVASGATLGLRGGTFVVDGSVGPATETFGDWSVNPGGSGVASIGAATLNLGGTFTRPTSGAAHFQSIGGGAITAAGLTTNARVGGFATFGANAANAPFASDWAATDGSGNIVAFGGYSVDSFGAGLHTDVQGAAAAGADTGSLRFNNAAGTIATGPISLDDGGVLFTSSHTGGTPFAAGTSLTTGGADLIFHNFATGDIQVDADIGGGQRVQFTGPGTNVLGGTNTYSGPTSITGGATVEIDDFARLGSTSGVEMNGGTLRYTAAAPVGANVETVFTLGGGMSTIDVSDAAGEVVFKGTANNQFTSEDNAFSSLGANTYAGGVTFQGAGRIQFGDRSSASGTTDVLGVTNNYRGLTIIGDGTTGTVVDIQGQPADNGQITPFGTTYNWADGTIVRNGSTVELAPRRGDTARDQQVRLREWFQWGENPGDNVTIDLTTYREVALDGFHNIVGDVYIDVETNDYGDDTGSATQHGTLYFGLNEGGIMGGGNITKNGNGTLQIRDNLSEWTGQLTIEDGTVVAYGQGKVLGGGTMPVILGVTDGAGESGVARVRVSGEIGTNNTDNAHDAPHTQVLIDRDFQVANGTNQDIRIEIGYFPTNGTVEFSGNIDLQTGQGSEYIRFYNEDSRGLNAGLVGEIAHNQMLFSGDITGSRVIRIESSEGGVNNQMVEGGVAGDQNEPIAVTVTLSGDNTGFGSYFQISGETGSTFDKDDFATLRFGSSTAADADNNVRIQNLGTLQAGGQTVTIGDLETNGGNSTTGVYSFTNNAAIPGSGTTAFELDHTGTGDAVAPVGGSSEFIENASSTPGTLTITQNTNANWDALFRDGDVSIYDANPAGAAASLNIVKDGTGTATLTIVNEYTGTTTVNDGTLQVGSAGEGFWATGFTQGTTMVNGVDVDGGAGLAGTTGIGDTTVSAGGTLAGTGNVRGSLILGGGTINPGDAGGDGAGTLFVGNGVDRGNFAMNSGTLTFNVFNNSDNVGGDVDRYDPGFLTTMSTLVGDYGADTTVNPGSFGSLNSAMVPGDYDHLEISGGVTWTGGKVNVVADPGVTFFSGDVLNLVDWFDLAGVTTDWGGFDDGMSLGYQTQGGMFGDFMLPDLSPLGIGYFWDTRLWKTDGVLVVVSPEPGRVALLGLGLGSLLLRRRRKGA